MTERDFDGLDVVVTGGTGALGRAVVEALLARGGTCHVPVVDASELEDFPHADHERVHVVRDVDLGDEAGAQAFYRERPPLWASLQLAGGFAMGPIAETSGADFRRLLDMNAGTCFLCCREAVKRIRERGRGGRLVNVSARPALVPAADVAAYAASKAAVAALTRCLAEELRDEEIWVNAVVPSVMDTPANRAGMPDADFDAWPKVEQVARVIADLASPANAVTRGALVCVYGRA